MLGLVFHHQMRVVISKYRHIVYRYHHDGQHPGLMQTNTNTVVPSLSLFTKQGQCIVSHVPHPTMVRTDVRSHQNAITGRSPRRCCFMLLLTGYPLPDHRLSFFVTSAAVIVAASGPPCTISISGQLRLGQLRL